MPLKPARIFPGSESGLQPEPDRQIKDLESPDAQCRRQAARALAGNQAGAAALVTRLSREDDVMVWDAILTSLAQTGGPVALDGLLEHLRNESTQLRNEVLEAVKTFPEGEIVPRVEKLLTDPDPHTRIAAVQLIQAVGPSTGVALLSAVLDREDHVNVAAAAVELLSEMGSPEAIPSLERARQRFAAQPFMVFAVDTAMRRIRHSETE